MFPDIITDVLQAKQLYSRLSLLNIKLFIPTAGLRLLLDDLMNIQLDVASYVTLTLDAAIFLWSGSDCNSLKTMEQVFFLT